MPVFKNCHVLRMISCSFCVKKLIRFKNVTQLEERRTSDQKNRGLRVRFADRQASCTAHYPSEVEHPPWRPSLMNDFQKQPQKSIFRWYGWTQSVWFTRMNESL